MAGGRVQPLNVGRGYARMRGRWRDSSVHTGSMFGYSLHVGLMRLCSGSLRASRTTFSLNAASYAIRRFAVGFATAPCLRLAHDCHRPRSHQGRGALFQHGQPASRRQVADRRNGESVGRDRLIPPTDKTRWSALTPMRSSPSLQFTSQSTRCRAWRAVRPDSSCNGHRLPHPGRWTHRNRR